MGESSAESSFWQSDRLFRFLVTNAEEYAIFSMDLGGRITTWNRGARRLLGWSAEEAVEQSSVIIFTEEDRAAGILEEEMTRAAATGRAEDTRWHLHKSGERFWANGIMTVVKDDAGKLIGFAKIIRDLTFQKRYEEVLEQKTAALERANRALQQSNRSLQAFASEVAHELRSPLMGIRLTIRAFSRNCAELMDEQMTLLARETQESIRDLDLFADELLSYARLGGDAELKGEHLDSTSALGEALSDLERLIEERGAEVQVNPLPTVWANRTLLRHLFRNLVSNAIRHNDAGVPHVWVEAEEEESVWIFRVADNGPGIPEEEREKIVSLFRGNELEEQPDLGIGLALSKRIVTRHGGRIWVESKPGEGCTFFFTLSKKREDTEGA